MDAVTAKERLTAACYGAVLIFDTRSYDDALIGVTTDGRAVYDFDKMVVGLVDIDGMSEIDATEWVEYNTIRARPYMGADAPIIIHKIE